MRDISDVDLEKTEPIPLGRVPEQQRPPVVWIVTGLIVLAAAVVAYLYFGRHQATDTTAGEASAPAAATSRDRPLGGTPEPIDVPPLAETDPLVRRLVGALSAHPTVTAWLATDDLIRNFVVVVENIANDVTPAGHLQVLKPSGSFRVVTRNDQTLLDPGGFERYNTIADAVGSIDAQGAARLYATLKPRFEEAYGELGRPDTFDQAFSKALRAMEQAPVIEGDAALVPAPAVGYEFSDPALERLSAPQKQLMRMGPRNQRVIQAKLREIGEALGASR
jgi:hypothetical protein